MYIYSPHMKIYIIFSIMGCIWQGVRGLTPAQAANPPSRK